MNYFATGAWGRVIQFTSLIALIVAITLISVAVWLRRSAPEQSRKLMKKGVWLIGLMPIAVLIFVAVTIALFIFVWPGY